MNNTLNYIAFTLLGIFVISSVSAQNFLDEEPRWYVRSIQTSPADPQRIEQSIVYRLGEEVELDTYSYWTLEMSLDSMELDWEQTEMLLRESGDTVYMRWTKGEPEQVYMIHRWAVGTEYSPCESISESIVLLDSNSIIVNDQHHLKYSAEWERWLGEVSIIQNVGYEDWMFGQLCYTDQGLHQLRCLYRGDSLVYSRSENTQCFSPKMTTGTNDFSDGHPRMLSTVYMQGDRLNLEDFDAGVLQVFGLDGRMIQEVEYPNQDLFLTEKGVFVVLGIGEQTLPGQVIVVQ